MNKILVAMGVGILPMVVVFIGIALVMSSFIVMVEWIVLLIELDILDGIGLVVVFLVFAIIVTCEIFIGAIILEKIKEWHDAYEASLPHIEIYEYPDGSHIEITYIDGEYSATELTTLQRVKEGDHKGLKARLVAEVEGKKV